MDVCVWNRCNNRCVMCTNPEGFGDAINSEPYSYENVVSRLDYVKQTRPDWENEPFCLTGGEPTSHPRFLDIVKELRKKYPDNEMMIASNGRMFAYPQFTREFLSYNPSRIEVAIHGSNAQKHDMITRVPGSFDQAIAGLRNILKYKKPWQELEIRVILLKLNLPDVGNIIEFISKEFPGIARIVLIFPEFEGMAGVNKHIVGVKYSDIKEHVKGLINRWNSNELEVRLYHFPLCALPSDLWRHTWRTLREGETAFLKGCDDCLYKKYCMGVHVDYLEEVGDEEFLPINKKTVDIEEESNENQFKYHPIRNIK